MYSPVPPITKASGSCSAILPARVFFRSVEWTLEKWRWAGCWRRVWFDFATPAEPLYWTPSLCVGWLDGWIDQNKSMNRPIRSIDKGVQDQRAGGPGLALMMMVLVGPAVGATRMRRRARVLVLPKPKPRGKTRVAGHSSGIDQSGPAFIPFPPVTMLHFHPFVPLLRIRTCTTKSLNSPASPLSPPPASSPAFSRRRPPPRSVHPRPPGASRSGCQTCAPGHPSARAARGTGLQHGFGVGCVDVGE